MNSKQTKEWKNFNNYIYIIFIQIFIKTQNFLIRSISFRNTCISRVRIINHHLNNLNSSNRRSIVLLVCQFHVQTRMQRFSYYYYCYFPRTFIRRSHFFSLKHLCAFRVFNIIASWEWSPFTVISFIGQRWKVECF